MNRIQLSWALAMLVYATPVHAQTRLLSIDSIECDTTLAWPLFLQSDQDAAPEWAVLIGRELVVSETRPGGDDRTMRLPEGASLFDVRDVDGNGVTDLAVVRGEQLDFWPDAFRAESTEPAVRVRDARFSALAYGSPRPARLFFSQQERQLLSAPIDGEPRLWTLDGAAVSSTSGVAGAPLALVFSQAWEAAPGPASMRGADEYQIIQQFQFEPPLASVRARTEAVTPSHGVRFAREASGAPSAEWPSFALRSSAADRVAFALAPPGYRDTLVHIRRADLEATPRPPAPKLVPGVLIVPGGHAPDVNGDGFADLVLWRSARPAPTLDSLARAAHSGGWAIIVTVHPFEPVKGRFAARPITWFRTDAPLTSVLSANVAGPFAHVRFDDVDGDSRDEMLTTGAGGEIVVWKFTSERSKAPVFRASFGEPVLGIEFTANTPDSGWVGVVRTSRAFHALTLPAD